MNFISAISDLVNTVLQPIEWLVAWIMFAFHTGLTAIGLPAASGLTWCLSIVGLVLVMRALMIPLFVKQIHASRRMQLIQPEIQKIQARYKGKKDPESRQAMTQETMELYKRTGTNPFSSCLPILVQSPFFFGLFRVLRYLSDIAHDKHAQIGPITKAVAAQAESSTLFGAQLSDTFTHATTLNTRVLTVVLIALMSISTFTTQRQLMMKNMPASALDNPFAKQQKLLLYVMPAFFAISGINFPIGVLLYWLTTNVWSMCQQFYVIRKMPAPGSPAERAMQERRQKRGKETKDFTVKGLDRSGAGAAEGGIGDVAGNGAAKKPGGQRQQPKRKKRRPSPGSAGATGASAAGPPGGATPRGKASTTGPVQENAPVTDP